MLKHVPSGYTIVFKCISEAHFDDFKKHASVATQPRWSHKLISVIPFRLALHPWSRNMGNGGIGGKL